jgi:hypothetical protein
MPERGNFVMITFNVIIVIITANEGNAALFFLSRNFTMEINY